MEFGTATNMKDDKNLKDFLRESNAIEGVHSERALNDAVQAWNFLIKQETMTVSVVKETHRILMQSKDAWEPESWGDARKYSGNFRDCPVYIGGREAVGHVLIESFLRTWCDDMNDEFGDDWKALHIEYERIHPFLDGNGRTGRMFMNWHRLKMGRPLLVVWKKEVKDYYSWFNRI